MKGNPFEAMKQLKKIQEKMAKIDEELEQTLVEGTAGGGVIKITMTAKEDVKEVKIDPEVVNKEEVDVLEDLVAAALRDALTKAKEKTAEKMGGLTDGLSLPPGLF
ncbi:MAG TPA: YbaB/EbfC family nucleoid-associated protein [Dictyoglomaceae bacterium]|nr:YbaB/EbfC family nucleoid-associated protein [Dictyoglomaceae bacterium]HOL39410.1 YbaB/EbfC family nucleoid-associated protein [Dictyoglomaceae bacterium]HOP95110.1 YbaB/EbfC family nucleoid-associated protein [Dictyoglomaceae bacterium]HPP16188.1 YbaB/EbfC family nucleoid-associated protein [Dictyoglomaceae bacterium]HPU43694.1 YbaB/EbfC family nucleoid-associated protein [Dictyoglomaceae bacterium]